VSRSFGALDAASFDLNVAGIELHPDERLKVNSVFIAVRIPNRPNVAVLSSH